MTLKELKKKINLEIKNGYGDLPVTVMDGESGNYVSVENAILQYPVKNAMWDRTQKPISFIMSRWRN